MSSTRTVLSAVAAWLVVVAVGSTLVWAVISRAGDGIAPTVGPEVSATSTAPSGALPLDQSSNGPSASATGPERRTWQGAGGVVIVECRGGSISRVSTSADAGFVVDPESRSSHEVRVSFEGQGDEGRETVVTARCEHGVPTFEVEASDD